MDLLALHLTLRPRREAELADAVFDHLQAAALSLLDAAEPGLGARVHDEPRDKPHAVGPLVDGELRYLGEGARLGPDRPVTWRLCGLNRPVAEALARLVAEPPECVWIGPLTCDVVGARVASSTACAALHEAWRSAEADDLPRSLRVDFVSPANVRTRLADGRNQAVLWPAPRWLFGRLAQRWNHLAAEPLAVDPPPALLSDDETRLDAYRAETLAVLLQGRRVPAFRGWFRWSLPADPAARRVAGLLAEFAPFAGWGARVSSGLGAVRTRWW